MELIPQGISVVILSRLRPLTLLDRFIHPPPELSAPLWTLRGCYDDTFLWHTLELVGIKGFVVTQEDKLDSVADDNGSNYSVGQRQLLCLAGVILRSPKILLLRSKPRVHSRVRLARLYGKSISRSADRLDPFHQAPRAPQLLTHR